MHFIFVAYKKINKKKSTVSSLRPPPLTLISVLVVILLQSRSGCGSRFNDYSHWAFRVTEIQTQLETVAAQIPEMMTVDQLCLCVNMELEHVQCL